MSVGSSREEAFYAERDRNPPPPFMVDCTRCGGTGWADVRANGKDEKCGACEGTGAACSSCDEPAGGCECARGDR